MDSCSEYMSSCSSGSSTENRDIINSNAAVINKENYVMDLRRLSSRIIFSENITRQSLNRKPCTSNAVLTSDDDEPFYQKMKSEIDKNLLLHSKQNHELNMNYSSDSSMARRKRPIIDVETETVMKRFKRDSNQINSVQTLNNTSAMRSNSNNNILKETRNISTNVNEGNIIQYKNLFSTNILNSRIPPSKYVFQMTSKLQKNVLPLATNETTILHEEYEESLFYGMMFLTPPNSSSIDDDDDS